MATTDARPVPKKNVAYRLYFDIRKNDGSLITTWAGQDTELSLDGGNYADATNEATEIQTSGTGYIDLTAGEMNADCVIVKTTVTNTGALPFVAVLFPTESADIPVDASASAVASVTAGVSLADDAITSAKFDESTAFPLKAADTGATQVARTGADSDTLETLSAQIDAVPTLAEFATEDTGETEAAAGSVAKLAQGAAGMTAQDIWEYSPRTLTQSAAEVASVIRGIVLTITRGDSLSASVTGLGDITGRKKLWFTVKGDLADEDAASTIQIEETAGLIYLNGAAGTALNGDIAVDDQSAGNITVTLKAAATAALAVGSYSYDIQWVDASDAVHTLGSGGCRVVGDVTRAIA